MTFDSEPCAGASVHAPRYYETERHHVRPKFLAALLGVPIDPRVVPLCAGCHQNVHHVLRTLINTGTHGDHRLPAGSAALVDDAWEWWQASILGGAK